MKITKIGHCCLLIEENGLRILTDPGAWSEIPADLGNIDVVLITHEHSDHIHIESLKQVLSQSPKARVITNPSVGKLLDDAVIKYSKLVHGESTEISGMKISGYGEKHAEIYDGIPLAENTGYLIAEKLFYPGDAFFYPGVKVKVLALPVAGPWLHIKEVINYAREVEPELAFPVHDGMLKHFGPFHALPQMLLPKFGIEFKPLLAGESLEV